jgi:hypothetical protein
VTNIVTDKIYAFLSDDALKDPWIFALLVIGVMALEGVLLGVLAEFLFKILGIEIKKIKH